MLHSYRQFNSRSLINQLSKNEKLIANDLFGELNNDSTFILPIQLIIIHSGTSRTRTLYIVCDS